jgi:hypothetical protein
MKRLGSIFFSLMFSFLFAQINGKFNSERFHEYFIDKIENKNKNDIITLFVRKKTDSLIVLHYEYTQKYKDFNDLLRNTYIDDELYYSKFEFNNVKYFLSVKDCIEKKILSKLYDKIKVYTRINEKEFSSSKLIDNYDPPRIEIFLTPNFTFNEKEFYKYYGMLGFSKDDEIIKNYIKEIEQFFK